MIKFEHTEVCGWDAAIRGMRNPKNSWAKSDSGWTDDLDLINRKDPIDYDGKGYFKIVGDNDVKLMGNLTNAGDDHGKVVRYLDIYVDITAPLYFWKEFRTYRKGRKFMDDGDDFTDVDDLEMHIETNSCSTMHKIHAREFTLDDFSHEHLIDENIWLLEDVIRRLNTCRALFIEDKNKREWWQMIQLLPSSYNQKRTVKLNYQVLRRMYHARKNHKLDEWRDFCSWCETLPYFKEVCVDVKEN